jgi:hypothetical protein
MVRPPPEVDAAEAGDAEKAKRRAMARPQREAAAVTDGLSFWVVRNELIPISFVGLRG